MKRDLVHWFGSDGEAHVLVAAGSLKHPHPSLLQTSRVVDVLQRGETREQDVQFCSREESRDQTGTGDWEWDRR